MASVEKGYKTHTGKVRSNNQDFASSFSTPSGELYVVCDGMGGHTGGEIASSLAVQEIGRVVLGAPPNSNISQLLGKAIDAANFAIYQKATADHMLQGMGTTGVILLLSDDCYYLAHVGDSRIYSISGGQISQITKDQSFVQILVDEGHISPAAAKDHPRKNEITHFIGEGPNMEHVVQGPFRLVGDERFLLCSDGLSDLVDADEIQRLGLLGHVQSTCDALVELALERGGYDNITVMMVKVGTPNASFRQTTNIVIPAVSSGAVTQQKRGKTFLYGTISVVAGLLVLLGILSNNLLNNAPARNQPANGQLMESTPEVRVPQNLEEAKEFAKKYKQHANKATNSTVLKAENAAEKALDELINVFQLQSQKDRGGWLAYFTNLVLNKGSILKAKAKYLEAARNLENAKKFGVADPSTTGSAISDKEKLVDNIGKKESAALTAAIDILKDGDVIKKAEEAAQKEFADNKKAIGLARKVFVTAGENAAKISGANDDIAEKVIKETAFTDMAQKAAEDVVKRMTSSSANRRNSNATSEIPKKDDRNKENLAKKAALNVLTTQTVINEAEKAAKKASQGKEMAAKEIFVTAAKKAAKNSGANDDIAEKVIKETAFTDMAQKAAEEVVNRLDAQSNMSGSQNHI